MKLPQIANSNDASSVLVLDSGSPEDTQMFGRFLADQLESADIVSLDGTLGAGKTLLTRGLAEGLHCSVPVSSPTFILLIEHPAQAGGLALYHFDVYRLTGSEEFVDAGLDEYFDTGGVCVIEWGGLINDILPDRTLRIQLDTPTPDQPDLRRLSLSWPGCPERLSRLKEALETKHREVNLYADHGD